MREVTSVASSATASARLAEGLAHLVLTVLWVQLLFVSARPIITADIWWHLVLGEAYTAAGPWLSSDPLLFTAPSSPAPAAWLSELLLYATAKWTGLNGLRIAHALAISGVLALVWWLARRASGSRTGASLITALFLVLASYRLFQLRPQIATIVATLTLYALVMEGQQVPGRLRILLAAALLGLWANLHAAFLLGPILIAAALTACLLHAWIARAWPAARPRVLALGATLLIGLLATLVNPSGATAHLAYFDAGVSSPDLSSISDEWAAFDPFSLPAIGFPPTPLVWALVWGLLVVTPMAAGVCGVQWLSRRSPVDPALLGIAVASLIAIMLAVRFTWLAIFPLLLLAHALRLRARPFRGAAALALASSGALLLGYLRIGDWPLLSNGVPTRVAAYRAAYEPARYHAHAIWFLHDAGLRGNIASQYALAGFLGYWTAPELRSLVNGSLNVPIEVMDAYHAIQAGRGGKQGESLSSLLDRLGVDVFLGTGVPTAPGRNRSGYTTAHLERAKEWTLVFRSQRGAVYLRRGPGSGENLERVAAYYAGRGVPFDPERGLEVDRVIQRASAWAMRNGMIRRNHDDLVEARFYPAPEGRIGAARQLARVYAALGLYEEALDLEDFLIRAEVDPAASLRRRIWLLLHLDRSAEALATAERLEARGVVDPLAARVIAAAREYSAFGAGVERDALVATLPVFTYAEGRALGGGALPELRLERRRPAK